MNSMTRCLPLLGSFVEINIQAYVSDGDLIKASQKAFDQIKIIQQKMSFHEENSEVSQVNKQAHFKEIELTEMTSQVIGFAQKLSYLTGGVFDITTASLLLRNNRLPNHSDFQSENIGFQNITLEGDTIRFNKPLTIDLGGIAKGYAVDQAIKAIKNELGEDLIQSYVNAGGDLKYTNWQDEQVFIPNIDKQTTAVTMLDSALATSSSYYLEGTSDIYNPFTKNQAKLQKTISVFAESCMVADGLTKVAALLTDHHSVYKELKAQVVYT